MEVNLQPPMPGDPHVVTIYCEHCLRRGEYHLGPMPVGYTEHGTPWLEMKLIPLGQKDFYGIGLK